MHAAALTDGTATPTPAFPKHPKAAASSNSLRKNIETFAGKFQGFVDVLEIDEWEANYSLNERNRMSRLAR